MAADRGSRRPAPADLVARRLGSWWSSGGGLATTAGSSAVVLKKLVRGATPGSGNLLRREWPWWGPGLSFEVETVALEEIGPVTRNHFQRERERERDIFRDYFQQ